MIKSSPLLLFNLMILRTIALPTGFVFLENVDPTIQQSVRYYGDQNFVGQRVNGYVIPKIVMTNQAAQALAKVQADLKQQGYCLVVYDAYRPQRAVNNFVSWSNDLADLKMKDRYYPTLDKSVLFDQGYIALKSGHTRGSTIDLSIIALGSKVHQVMYSKRQLTDSTYVPFNDDGTVDMGSSFDLFHPASFQDSPYIDKDHTANRNILRNAMKKQGFNEYANEWWHFTLANEPFPNTYFDFTIDEVEEDVKDWLR